jgi:hypothetical protein
MGDITITTTTGLDIMGEVGNLSHPNPIGGAPVASDFLYLTMR